jgi:hypothetical protein
MCACSECGARVFKADPDSKAERKRAAGFLQEMKTAENGPRSDAGSFRQAMKGHLKFKKKVNTFTNEPYQSIQDRFDNDIMYQFRMLSNGRTREMLPGLQSLLQNPLLGDRQCHRRRTSPTLT